MQPDIEYVMGLEKLRTQQNEILTQLEDEDVYAISSIKGPYDACSVSYVRSHLLDHIEFGPHQLSDVFLLGTKPCPNRALYTQLGGQSISGEVAFASDGTPLPLIAQLDFRYSKDVCNFVESDILLVFGEPFDDKDLVCRWVNFNEAFNASAGAKHSETSLSPCLYAWYRWRTQTFPSWTEIDGSDLGFVSLASGKTVWDLDFFMQPLALQIGMFPMEPPAGFGDMIRHDESIIATIPTLYAQSTNVWEFADKSRPLELDDVSKLSFVLGGRDLGYDPLSVIYVISSERNGVRAKLFMF